MSHRIFALFLSNLAASPGVVAAAAAVAIATAASGEAPLSYRAGSVVVEAPWARATPGGATVAVGYMRIRNQGTEPDRLTGGTAAVATGVELHETSTAGGVARMRPLDAGLVIRPGEAVELKPGGLHLMLVGLKQPLKQGDVVKGTLVFEKAGTVAVEYRVGGIGARAPAAAAADRASTGSAGHHH